MRAEEKAVDIFLENGWEWPKWLVVKNPRTLIVTVNDWQGTQEHEVTIEDIVEYFASEARNILSGIRKLGNITGDWRQIDELAHFCHEIFKITAMKELRSAAKKYGLKPRY